MSDLPLFSWEPPRKLLAFPMVNRVGKIRDVAVKMLDKSTERHAEHYRNQVTEALIKHLDRIGLSENEVDEQLGAFWQKVQDEMTRRTHCAAGSNNPKGAA
ncbi:DUF6074 family protein [Rhizobium sp. TRM96647]|uniref:DUF6074 family protein n=1 Tax=unclassified Rhizobium TaxID=2613769 RepID=UPI0021E91F91|nr:MULTISPECIES: DUF6074 family protein [unclassified Rhizobium]MCV3738360.1 DUF6074 family protein [Rhizobium sp. TRM96647]MCV3759891.1 DUF6074 family protein [Rhizobium sp. TRM96650]